MAPLKAGGYSGLLDLIAQSPHGYVWCTYDGGADVLYINFKKPAVATDSELTDEDIIVRYEGDEIIGLTILHARARNS